MNCTLMEIGVGLSGLGELECISKNLRHECPQDKILSHVLRGVKHMPNLIQNFPYQPANRLAYGIGSGHYGVRHSRHVAEAYDSDLITCLVFVKTSGDYIMYSNYPNLIWHHLIIVHRYSYLPRNEFNPNLSRTSV